MNNAAAGNHFAAKCVIIAENKNKPKPHAMPRSGKEEYLL
jgi:hypothetical protein